MRSVTDADRERILGLEVIFSIEAKFCQEAKDNVRLFWFKNWFFGFFVFAHFSFIFSAPFKKQKIEISLYLTICRVQFTRNVQNCGTAAYPPPTGPA
jgi:hypothetical protein